MAINEAQERWLRQTGLLRGEPLDRRMYEQEWPKPMEIDADMPKPWYVAAYSGSALGNVLRSDYGATYRDGVYTVDGGEMLRIHKSGDLYGTHGGTIFVLHDPWWREHPELHRICEVAHGRGIRIEELRTRS